MICVKRVKAALQEAVRVEPLRHEHLPWVFSAAWSPRIMRGL